MTETDWVGILEQKQLFLGGEQWQKRSDSDSVR